MMLEGIGTFTVIDGAPRNSSSASYRKVSRFQGLPDASAGPATAPAASSYTIQRGDTLAGIVRNQLKALGKPADNASVFDAVQDIARANGLKNANRIHPGQTLDLSALDAGAPRNTPAAALPMPPASTSPPEIDVRALPPLPQATSAGADPAEKEVPVPAPSRPEIQPQSKAAPVLAPESGGAGGGRNAPIGALASFAGQRSLLLSPGPQGGPAHPLGRDLLAELAPEVRYPLRASNGRPDLNALLDRLLDPAAAAPAAAAPEAIDHTGMPWERAVAANTRVTSGFGPRRDPFSRKKDFHAGLDLAAAHGSNIHPIQPGTVTFSGWKSGYGRVIFVDHGNGIESVYGHNAKNLVSVGQKVDETTVLGHVGSSGRSTGPHLHLEIRQGGKPIDPVTYLSDPANATLAKN